MHALDTKVLLRLIWDDDPAQTEAAQHFIRGGAWVSLLVLAECFWVLESRFGLAPRQLASALQSLLTHRDLTIQDSPTAQAALDQFRAHPKLGFSDCLILQIAINAGHTPLATFDKTLGKLPGAQRL